MAADFDMDTSELCVSTLLPCPQALLASLACVSFFESLNACFEATVYTSGYISDTGTQSDKGSAAADLMESTIPGMAVK